MRDSPGRESAPPADGPIRAIDDSRRQRATCAGIARLNTSRLTGISSSAIGRAHARNTPWTAPATSKTGSAASLSTPNSAVLDRNPRRPAGGHERRVLESEHAPTARAPRRSPPPASFRRPGTPSSCDTRGATQHERGAYDERHHRDQRVRRPERRRCARPRSGRKRTMPLPRFNWQTVEQLDHHRDQHRVATDLGA